MLPRKTAAPPAVPAPPPVTSVEGLKPVEPADLPDLSEDLGRDRQALLKAVRKSLDYLRLGSRKKEGGRNPPPAREFRIADKKYGTGALLETLLELERLLSLEEDPTGSRSLVGELRNKFDLYQSVGTDGKGRVVFSAYYMPLLPASLKTSEAYRYPLYKRPPDLAEVNLAEFDSKWEGQRIIGRFVAKEGRVVPFYSRDEIESHKALKGRGLELAWVKNKFDLLDLHIQGSGILQFPSGKKMLAKFAATNNLPYKSVGSVLIQSGAMAKEEMSHARLRRYFQEHPEAQDWVIAQNPRYTFFEVVPLPEDKEPFGTMGESLTPLRSVAVDPKIVPMGAVALMVVNEMPRVDAQGNLLAKSPETRLILCQDTGGAIKGPGRVDFYTGHGPQAKGIATNLWSEGRLFILIKKL